MDTMLCVVGSGRQGGSGGGPEDGVRGRVRPQPFRACVHARRSLGAAQTARVRCEQPVPASSAKVGREARPAAARRGYAWGGRATRAALPP
eukprot:5254172-Pleurochrysis_carterae.AAC.1